MQFTIQSKDQRNKQANKQIENWVNKSKKEKILVLIYIDKKITLNNNEK